MKSNKEYSLRKLVSVVIVALVAVSTNAATEEALFAQADQAAQEQRLADMQRIYEIVLQTDSTNVRALTGKAAAQAWQGDFTAAQETYEKALSLDSENIDAHVGLGYAYAWAGRYTKAHTSFRRALRRDPMNIGARKGIAYSYQWAGEYELALESLELAQSIAPDDAEIAETSGRVTLSLGHARDAVGYFDRALQLDPQRESARLARRSAFTTAPALELSSRVGSTSSAGSGLRMLEVAHWASLGTRFAARYDNSLGLDNSSIADRGEDAPGYFISVQQTIRNRWLAAVEFGRRDLVGGDQDILTVQGVYNNAVAAIRLGAQLGNHDEGHTDRLLFGGVNFGLGDNWRLEPAVYLSQSGAAKDDEWRGVLNVEYQPQTIWKIGAFVGAGQIDASDPEIDGSTVLAGVWGNILIADRHTVHIAIRREESPTNDFTVAELGFTYRMPGN